MVSGHLWRRSEEIGIVERMQHGGMGIIIQYIFFLEAV